MSTEYFEHRERALLGERYDGLYAAPQRERCPRRDGLGPAHHAGGLCRTGGLPWSRRPSAGRALW